MTPIAASIAGPELGQDVRGIEDRPFHFSASHNTPASTAIVSAASAMMPSRDGQSEVPSLDSGL